MSKYFVKFRRWNDHTINSLISKKVRLSRVFDFNDFNEYGFRIPDFSIDPDVHVIFQQIICLLCREDYRKSLIQFVKDTARTKCISKKIEKALDQNKLTQLFEKEFYTDLYSTFCEHFVSYHTAIFCVSDIDVFKNGAAQLMFAHYAENCSGVALIYKYETTKGFKKIEYLEKSAGGTFCAEALSERGILNNKENFLKKTCSWAYEHEWRYVDYHGASGEYNPYYSLERPLSELGLELVSVLYTGRFDKNHKDYLEYIAAKYYDSKLKIQEIYPDRSGRCFKVRVNECKDNQKVLEWLTTASSS